MKRLFWIFHVDPKCNHMYLYKREAERDLMHPRGKGNVTTWRSFEWCSHKKPKNAGSHQTLEEARNGFASRKSMALLTHWFQFGDTDLDLEVWGNRFLIFTSPCWWQFDWNYNLGWIQPLFIPYLHPCHCMWLGKNRIWCQVKFTHVQVLSAL